MNTKHHNQAATALLASLLAALVLSACNNEYGIYKSILEEKPAPSSGANFRSSVGEVISFDNAVWTRAATIMKKSGAEARASVQGGGLPAAYVSTGIAATSTTLYAAIYTDGLYSLGAGGSSWTRPVIDTTIESVFMAHNTLFVADHNEKGTTADTSDDSWTLSTYSGTGSSLSPVPLTLATGTPILSVLWDGSAYWVLTPVGLYSSASETATFALDSAPWDSATRLASIATGLGTAKLYVGTTDGRVFTRTAGSWTAEAIVASSSYAVTALAELPVGASSNRLIAGFGGKTTGAAGYVEIDLAATPPTVNAGNGSAAKLSTATIYDTNLADKPVNGLFLIGYSSNSGNATLYASVAGGLSGSSGLYVSSYTYSGASGAWDGWTSE